MVLTVYILPLTSTLPPPTCLQVRSYRVPRAALHRPPASTGDRPAGSTRALASTPRSSCHAYLASYSIESRLATLPCYPALLPGIDLPHPHLVPCELFAWSLPSVFTGAQGVLASRPAIEAARGGGAVRITGDAAWRCWRAAGVGVAGVPCGNVELDRRCLGHACSGLAKVMAKVMGDARRTRGGRPSDASGGWCCQRSGQRRGRPAD